VVAKAYSIHGCSVYSFDNIVQVMESTKVYFGIIAISLGIYLCFFGLKTEKVTAFLIGFILFSLIGMVLLAFLKIKQGYSESDVYFVIIGGLIPGILAGVLLAYFTKLITFIAGFAIGVILVFTFQLLFLDQFNSDNKYIFWLIVLAGGIVFGAVALIFHDWIIIIVTTLYGAQMIVAGVLFFVSTETLENYIVNNKEKKTYVQVLILAADILLVVAGFFFQLKYKRRKDKKGEAKDKVKSTYDCEFDNNIEVQLEDIHHDEHRDDKVKRGNTDMHEINT
jgi:hypothetical protein